MEMLVVVSIILILATVVVLKFTLAGTGKRQNG